MPLAAPAPARAHPRLALLAIALVLLAGCTSAGSGTPSTIGQVVDGQLAQRLKSDVSESGAFTHLQALQKIADEHGGHRAAPGPGYQASVDHVIAALRAAGYDVGTAAYGLSQREGGGDGQMTSQNIIAQTRTGDPGHVVMIGAHLDSVKKGPGIVDDGSGVAALLNIAGHLGASPPVRNAVRFAFFGSEENGSQGSRSYIESLSAEDRGKIMLYLNVDMVASPNGGYFVQGGTGSNKSAAGPPGSATVAHVLADQLAKTGVTAQMIEFVGDDESPFVAANIPAAGAENGDRRKKSEEQAQIWGGQAGQEFDPCYHTACDRLDNVNRIVLDHYLHALAGTVAYFATSGEKLS